jgi:hypothetical protein
MRALRFLSLVILSILVGSSALVYAQDDKQQEDKPPRQEEPNPQPKQDEAKPPAQEKQAQKQEQKDSRDQAKPQDHPEQQADHARPAGKSARIPDDKFRAHFGHSHTFTAKTVIVSGRPQFQYGGYNFTLVDAWPVGWAYTDNCYIDYIDGEYFLFDLLHPGVRMAIVVVL